MNDEDVLPADEVADLDTITAAYHTGDVGGAALLDALLGDASAVLAAIEAGEYTPA